MRQITVDLSGDVSEISFEATKRRVSILLECIVKNSAFIYTYLRCNLYIRKQIKT